ncbi:MAG: hypothetical protein R6V58_13665 [Planctomycetota bacterium]
MPEPIDVISMFRDRVVRPVKFRYAGRTHKVARVLYNWVTREGRFPVHHFAVLTEDGNRYGLSLNTYTMAWTLGADEAAGAGRG